MRTRNMRNVGAALVVAFLHAIPSHAGLPRCGGTVAVSLSANGKTVEMLGDDEANCVDVFVDDTTLYASGRRGTTVLGSPLALTSATRISIVLKNGDDSLSLIGTDVPTPELSNTDLKVVLGDGIDDAFIDGVQLRRLVLSMGAGDDTVRLAEVEVTTKSPVNGGKGVDSYFLAEPALSAGSIATDGPVDLKGFESLEAEGGLPFPFSRTPEDGAS